MLGQTLHNRYTVTTRLGKGAMGIVYRATDSQTGQDVAIKVIARELAFDEAMLERFKREAEALRQLSHPNIVSFVDAFQHEDQYAIVMEYVPGGSLHDLIKQGPLSVERARQIALDLCDALIRAHRLDIIHRDLKPENILIAQNGTPKLTDFGVARLSQGTRLTGTGTQVGTPYYMSPEAWEGKPLDAQADIWSLGIVFYEMLTGEVPFGGDTVVVVMNKVLTTPLPGLKNKRADAPDGIVWVIQRMLARKRAERYQTMREAAADIERGQPTLLPAPVRGVRLPVWIASGLGLMIAGALTITLLVGGIYAVRALGDQSGAQGTLVNETTDTLESPTPSETGEPAITTDTPQPGTEVPTDKTTATPRPDTPFVGAKVEALNCDYGGKIKSIIAVDRLTVRFNLCRPEPAFLVKIALVTFAIQPSEWIEQTGGAGEILEKPIGTGPYMLDTWQRGDNLTLKRFDNYWGDKAKTETLIFRWAETESQRLQELQAGTVDQISDVSLDNFAVVFSDSNLRLLPFVTPSVFYIGMNTNFGPFSDVRVRQAIAMGIDRQQIVDRYYQAGTQLATHFTPCTVPNGCAGDPWYDLDIERARALLAEAGYPNGFNVNLYYRDIVRTYLPESELVAAELQTQLQENLNITVETRDMVSGVFITEATAGNLEMYLLGWSGDYSHVTNFLDYHFSPTNPQFGDPFPELYTLVQAAAQAADAAQAAERYTEVNNKIRELAPMVPVAHASGAGAALASLSGAHVHPFRSPRFAAVDGGSDGKIVFMQATEPPNLYCADEISLASANVCDQVLESLYGYKIDSGDVEPVLATSCIPTADLTEWVCALREGVTFHDGSEFDANDVVATWAAGIDASNPNHTGNTGSFDFFVAMWDVLMNMP